MLTCFCYGDGWQAQLLPQSVTRGRYHGGRRPSSEDSFHSPTVSPPSALDKPSITKRTTRWGVTARSPTMVTFHDTRFVECRWWNDGWTVKTVVIWRSSASMIPAPGVAAVSSLIPPAKLWSPFPLLSSPPSPTLPLRHVGLVERRMPRERPGFDSFFHCGSVSRSSHTSDANIGTPVAALPGAWRYRVSAGAGWPGVSILWLGEIETLICNFSLSVAACPLVWADPYLSYTRILLGC